MRISTASSFESGVNTLTRRQAELAAAQERLSSGKRVARASDDPAAAARAEHALIGILRADTSQRAVDASRIAMGQTETAMGDASALLQRAREAVVAAGNAGMTDTDRATIAQELRLLREQLLGIANRSDGAGSYLFGGQGATQLPFIDAPGGVQFAASPGQSGTEYTTALPLTTDGQAAFLSARTGNGVFETSPGPGVTTATIDNGRVSDPALLTGANYTLQFTVSGGATTYAVLRNGAATSVTAAPYVSGAAIDIDGMSLTVSGAPAHGNQFNVVPSTPTLSIFDVLDAAVTQMSTRNRTGHQVAQTTADALRDIDASMTTLQATRSAAGMVLNRIDSETDRLAGQKLTRESERSDAEDLDMVHAISAFQAKQSGYDAALRSYSMVQRLSLTQYLG